MPQPFDTPSGAPVPMITIGCFASLGRDRLADRLVAFNAACPEVGIGVHEMGYAELLPAVLARRLTLAIRPGGPVAGLAGCDLWAERAVVAMGPGHRHAGCRDIAAAMLQGEILLVSREREREQLHRFLVDRLFPGPTPATRIVADARRRQLLDRVAGGEGVALLCASQVDAGMAQLVVKPIADADAVFRMRVHWLAGREEPAVGRLVEMLEASREE